MTKLTANVIGATGLVGSHLVKQLLQDDRFEQVQLFTRRTTGLSHPKLSEQLVDFDQIENWSNLIQGDVLFSTLGTTLKKAGSKEKQFLIDYTYQYQVAEAAAKNKVSTYVLVSSAGANASSKLFYSQMKGKLDEAVNQLSFKKVVILRPSILDGERPEQRTTEQIGLEFTRWLTRFAFKKYRPIHGKTVAQAMIKAVFINHPNSSHLVYELGELFDLANSSSTKQQK
ncbi:NAD(P)H-binding protein [Sunxiuqinia sp. sy24]|uniref:NAD(P)H-binding protein n=1 Tax=Sunxiuqinia sp. sy24 TaxID=3461495 RepID=UPI0040459628